MEYDESRKIGKVMDELGNEYEETNSSTCLYLYLEVRDKVIEQLDAIKQLKKNNPNWRLDNDISGKILKDDIIDDIIVEMKSLAEKRYTPIKTQKTKNFLYITTQTLKKLFLEGA